MTPAAWLYAFASAALTAIAGVATVAAQPAGDAVRGERQFQRCFACHSVDPDETAKLQGPSLYRVVGRAVGAVAGFDYSDAMAARRAAGLVWDAATLDRYMADPEAVVPGTRMSVPPLRDAADRADLIAYLMRAAPPR